jgi:hypothetical protein
LPASVADRGLSSYIQYCLLLEEASCEGQMHQSNSQCSLRLSEPHWMSHLIFPSQTSRGQVLHLHHSRPSPSPSFPLALCPPPPKPVLYCPALYCSEYQHPTHRCPRYFVSGASRLAPPPPPPPHRAASAFFLPKIVQKERTPAACI